MGDNVWVNADRSEVVDLMSPGKKFQMRRKEAVRLGLLPDGDAKPQARRNTPERPAVGSVSPSAPPADEPVADSVREVTKPREDSARTFSTAPKRSDYAARRAAAKK